MASKVKAKPATGGTAQPTQATDFEKMEEPLDEQELESLYAWVDSIPLSRPKRNISRDFSDGVLVAEIVKHFFPNEGIVELHNYTAANATNKKKENWYYLNRRVFSRMNFELAEDVINDLVACKPGMIEKVLLMLQVKIKRAEYARGRQSDKPEADQHLTPGRKDGKMIKVGMEDTKGNRFIKTKQKILRSRQDRGGPVKTKRPKEKEIEYEPVKAVRFLDQTANKSDLNGKRLQENKTTPSKTAAKTVTVGVPKRRPGPVVESDVVPRYVVEEKEQEVLSRDETIQILQAKVKKMEHLLHLKDMRIADLTEHVGYATNTNDYKVYNKPSNYGYK